MFIQFQILKYISISSADIFDSNLWGLLSGIDSKVYRNIYWEYNISYNV